MTPSSEAGYVMVGLVLLVTPEGKKIVKELGASLKRFPLIKEVLSEQ